MNRILLEQNSAIGELKIKAILKHGLPIHAEVLEAYNSLGMTDFSVKTLRTIYSAKTQSIIDKLRKSLDGQIKGFNPVIKKQLLAELESNIKVFQTKCDALDFQSSVQLNFKNEYYGIKHFTFDEETQTFYIDESEKEAIKESVKEYLHEDAEKYYNALESLQNLVIGNDTFSEMFELKKNYNSYNTLEVLSKLFDRDLNITVDVNHLPIIKKRRHEQTI